MSREKLEWNPALVVIHGKWVTNPNSCVPHFLVCHLKRTDTRAGYPEEPTTIGGHLKKRRLDLGLRQKGVAGELRVNFKTYGNWEQGRE